MKRGTVKNLVRTAVMAAVMAVCAWITIPGPVPFTLQVFGIAAAVCFLGGKYGTIAMAVYLLVGAAGAPVFSGFKGGFGVLAGPTGGYLWGFLLMGLLYWGGTALFGEKRWLQAVLLLTGLLLCYLTGTLWFVYVSGAAGKEVTFGAALGMCVLPFVLPDLVKLYLAWMLGGFLRKRLEKEN